MTKTQKQKTRFQQFSQGLENNLDSFQFFFYNQQHQFKPLTRH